MCQSHSHQTGQGIAFNTLVSSDCRPGCSTHVTPCCLSWWSHNYWWAGGVHTARRTTARKRVPPGRRALSCLAKNQVVQTSSLLSPTQDTLSLSHAQSANTPPASPHGRCSAPAPYEAKWRAAMWQGALRHHVVVGGDTRHVHHKPLLVTYAAPIHGLRNRVCVHPLLTPHVTRCCAHTHTQQTHGTHRSTRF